MRMLNAEAFPNTIEACQVLNEAQNEVNQSLARELEKAKFEIEQLKRYIYGRRSERYTDDSSQLTFFAAEQDVQPEATAEVDEVLEEVTYTRRKRSKAERFPANLPREVQMIDVPEAERACPCCGEEMPIIDTDVRERLVW